MQLKIVHGFVQVILRIFLLLFIRALMRVLLHLFLSNVTASLELSLGLLQFAFICYICVYWRFFASFAKNNRKICCIFLYFGWANEYLIVYPPASHWLHVPLHDSLRLPLIVCVGLVLLCLVGVISLSLYLNLNKRRAAAANAATRERARRDGSGMSINHRYTHVGPTCTCSRYSTHFTLALRAWRILQGFYYLKTVIIY